MLAAAKNAGLEDPFVRTMELGDFSVSYRAAGLLPNVKHFLTSRSNLRNAVLDALHDDDIEIVSPNFMNQRIFDKEDQFVPRLQKPRTEPESATLESLAFDKADQAASVERLKEIRQSLGEEIEALKAGKEPPSESPPSRQERKKTVERLAKRREHVEALIQKKETHLDQDD